MKHSLCLCVLSTLYGLCLSEDAGQPSSNQQSRADSARGLWDNLGKSNSMAEASSAGRVAGGHTSPGGRGDAFWQPSDIDMLEHGVRPRSHTNMDDSDFLSQRGHRLGHDVTSRRDPGDQAQRGRRFEEQAMHPVSSRRSSEDGPAFGESTISEVMRIHRLTSDTLDSLQGKRGHSGQHRGSRPKRRNVISGGRRPPGINRRQGEALPEDQVELIDVEQEKARLAAQVNAVNVLDMIKNLQEEIQEIDNEIQAEHEKIRKLKETKQMEEELNLELELDDVETIPTLPTDVAQESAEETMKELALQKEDTTMKKVIAQMMLMKQIQKKKSESERLELALQALADRRKVINTALKQQREIAEEKRQLAKLEIERQKEIMAEKEKVIEQILQRNKGNSKENKNNRGRLEQQRLKPNVNLQNLIKQQGSLEDKAGMLEAHLRLVDKSNDRILTRLQELKLQREREAIAEQERVLQEQQAAITALRKMKKERKKKEKLKRLRDREELNLGGGGGGGVGSIRDIIDDDVETGVDGKAGEDSSPLAKLREAALINLQPGERRKVLEWLDLERNAAILQKTDQKIAEKLRAKNAVSKLTLADDKSPAAMIKSAAQILLEEGENELTDEEIDEILGIAGIDNGLTVENVFGIDSSLLDDDDDDDIVFADYDYNEYDEVVYEYEDVAVEPGEYDLVDYDDDEYVEKEYIYEYEETLPPLPALPAPTQKPKPRPRYRPVHTDYYSKPSYSPHYDTYSPPTYHPPKYHSRPSSSFSAGRHSLPRRPPQSGAQFLDEVSGLLGEAEHAINHNVRPHITLTGSLRNALLRDVDEKVHTEVHRLPGGRVSTKVHIGLPSNPVTSRIPTDQAVRDPFERSSTNGRNPSRKRQRLRQSSISLSGSLASGRDSPSSALTSGRGSGFTSGRDRPYGHYRTTTTEAPSMFPFLSEETGSGPGDMGMMGMEGFDDFDGIDARDNSRPRLADKLIAKLTATEKPRLTFSDLMAQRQEFGTNNPSFGALVHTRG